MDDWLLNYIIEWTTQWLSITPVFAVNLRSKTKPTFGCIKNFRAAGKLWGWWPGPDLKLCHGTRRR